MKYLYYKVIFEKLINLTYQNWILFFSTPYKSCFYIDFLLIVKNSNLFHEKTTIFIETNEIDFQNINLNVVFFRKISGSFLYCLKLN